MASAKKSPTRRRRRAVPPDAIPTADADEFLRFVASAIPQLALADLEAITRMGEETSVSDIKDFVCRALARNTPRGHA